MARIMSVIISSSFASASKLIRHIERFFGTFTRDLVELVDGFVGHNVDQRSRIEDRKAFAQRIGSAKEEGRKAGPGLCAGSPMSARLMFF